MNKAILVGRITKDIDLRYTNENKAVASFTVAVNRDKEHSDFINCVTWEKQAENIKKYCAKGSLIAVEGRISTRSYDDKEGKKIYVTEVVTSNVQFLGKKEGQAITPQEVEAELKQKGNT